jgi:hypothetical protein
MVADELASTIDPSELAHLEAAAIANQSSNVTNERSRLPPGATRHPQPSRLAT